MVLQFGTDFACDVCERTAKPFETPGSYAIRDEKSHSCRRSVADPLESLPPGRDPHVVGAGHRRPEVVSM
jgi:hypothetical protein